MRRPSFNPQMPAQAHSEKPNFVQLIIMGYDVVASKPIGSSIKLAYSAGSGCDSPCFV